LAIQVSSNFLKVYLPVCHESSICLAHRGSKYLLNNK
jgi:hypothetical protein